MIKSSHLFHLELNEANPGAEQRKTMAHQCVSGYSCMEVDRIFEYRDGIELMEGDRIVYENVGGYTMSLNPLFIQYFPELADRFFAQGGISRTFISAGTGSFIRSEIAGRRRNICRTACCMEKNKNDNDLNFELRNAQ